ncbi:MAG: hypothetical protein ACI4MR_06595 [Candidatus Aphodomorpha sp.]
MASEALAKLLNHHAVDIELAKKALLTDASPVEDIRPDGKPCLTYCSGKAMVSLNPDTHFLIQTNTLGGGKEIDMLIVSEEDREFLIRHVKNAKELIKNDDLRSLLIAINSYLMYVGFDENDHFTDEGFEVQCLYDRVYDDNALDDEE